MAASNAAAALGGGPDEIMLFGVRVVVDSMRKSVSLNNLSQYEHPSSSSLLLHGSNKEKDDVLASGYGSADDAGQRLSSAGPRSERRRGVPWTEEEHKLFLIGLHKVGKGDWRGISRNFVKTRTPTQVASHAQKYFLRRLNINRRRRRSSLFDITTDTVTGIEEQAGNPKGGEPRNNSINNFPAVMPAFSLSSSSTPTDQIPVDNLSSGQQGNQCILIIAGAGSSDQNLIRPVQHVDDPSSFTRSTSSARTISDVDLNLPLSSTSDQMHFAYRTTMATALSA
ncbi:Transcription factor MYB1R1 [Linum grandiflorum]